MLQFDYEKWHEQWLEEVFDFSIRDRVAKENGYEDYADMFFSYHPGPYFTKEQRDFLRHNNILIYYEDPTDEEWVVLEDSVGDLLVTKGLDENYEPNEIGKMCESILDVIP